LRLEIILGPDLRPLAAAALDQEAGASRLWIDLEKDRGPAILQLDQGRQRQLVQFGGSSRLDASGDLQPLGDPGKILEVVVGAGTAMVMSDLGRVGRHAEELRDQNEGEQ
jgi:hypothetical protein